MNNIISTKVNIFRNLKDYKFVPKLTEEQKQEIKQKVESIAVDKDVQITLFDIEHITISATNFGFDENLIEKVNSVANVLSQKLAMAYSDEFGYLMSDLNRIGSGLYLECELCLPSILSINKIDQVRQNIANLGYQLKSTERAENFILNTTCNLGYTSEEVYKNFVATVTKLQDLEIESAKMLDVSNHDDLLDKTLRSEAILSAAYLLRTDELCNIISNLRTGLNLGLTQIAIDKINKLQTLVTNQNKEFISQSELKDLAKKAKQILKGE